MMVKSLMKLWVAGCLALPMISNAQPKSIENNKSIRQGIKENPIMGYVVPKIEDVRIHKVHSDPKTGSLRITYNNEKKNRLSSVSAKKSPSGFDKEKAAVALAEGIDKALTKKATSSQKRSFTTDKGVEVNCIGVIEDSKKRSNSICFAVFDNYYIQANMVWGINGESKEQAFSRSDGFVKAVIDRFSEYPEI